MPHPEEPQHVHEILLSPPPPLFIYSVALEAKRGEIEWTLLHPPETVTEEPSLKEKV